MNLEYFTADNIRRDALAGTVTGMVAVPLTKETANSRWKVAANFASRRAVKTLFLEAWN